MDLSGIIFVVLAVGWAGYLIPKALKHHDDLAMSRPVETFSDSVRVVGASATKRAVQASAASTAPAAATAAPTAPVTAPAPADASAAEAPIAPEAGPESVHPVPPVPTAPTAPAHPLITRAAARRAAQRRRRVLAGLLLALVVVTLTSYLGVTPWWSTAVPGGLIVAFLVVARLTVRAQQVRRAAPVQPATRTDAVAPAEQSAPTVAAPADVEPDLGREDTAGLSREQLAEAVAAPVLDDGGLWDPLPVTLPTYVNKARARRTVRTIEITGMTSSGHDAADTALARTAAEAAKAEADARAEAEAEAEQRRAAGA